MSEYCCGSDPPQKIQECHFLLQYKIFILYVNAYQVLGFLNAEAPGFVEASVMASSDRASEGQKGQWDGRNHWSLSTTQSALAVGFSQALTCWPPDRKSTRLNSSHL